MSSHREAPLISKDPVADNTDVYAFVSPDRPNTVTIISNWIPLEEPAGGPNFFQFGDGVLYEILIDNNSDGIEDVRYSFRFQTEIRNPDTFLYNVGPISSLSDPNLNVFQTYSVIKTQRTPPQAEVLATGVPVAPSRIGPRSTPNYETLANSAIRTIPDAGGGLVFAGQRDDPFFVDLGSIFDLGGLRPFNFEHLIPLPLDLGRDGLKGFNVHTIALQVPISALTQGGVAPEDPLDPQSVIGVWARSSRQKVTALDGQGGGDGIGPFVQVSRLANPLVNEVLIPLGKKDYWNSQHPKNDSQFGPHYDHPELAGLLPVLYPTLFPNLASLNASGAPRLDIVAALLTGIPAGIISGFQNYTGGVQADMLRLNVAIPPSAAPDPLGLLGGDLAGFPNGRRLPDDVVAIELRALAGAIYPLIDPSFTPDAAASQLTDGTSNDVPLRTSFPYVGVPHEGYQHLH